MRAFKSDSDNLSTTGDGPPEQLPPLDDAIRFANARLSAQQFYLDRDGRYDRPGSVNLRFRQRDLERWKLIVAALEEYKAHHDDPRDPVKGSCQRYSEPGRPASLR